MSLVEPLGQGFVFDADSSEEREAELGDLFFAVVNLARWFDLDAENALRGTNHRFLQRFQFIEREAEKKGATLTDMTLGEMDEIWEQAKRSGL